MASSITCLAVLGVNVPAADFFLKHDVGWNFGATFFEHFSDVAAKLIPALITSSYDKSLKLWQALDPSIAPLADLNLGQNYKNPEVRFVAFSRGHFSGTEVAGFQTARDR